MMDAFTDPDVEELVIMSSAQIGKTDACMLNPIGYIIDVDPGPILCVLPTEQIAQALSKDRLAPMVRDTPRLTGVVKDARAKDSANTILHKTFPGGHITLAGANSPASLSSRPVRCVLLDELDRFPESAGAEGSPSDLAIKRTQTFWNRKIVKTSTPTVRGYSVIESAYEQSDRRKFWIPCPHCDEFQLLTFDRVQWEKDKKGKHLPETAVYACVNGCVITDVEKVETLSSGEWRAEEEFNGTAGFFINELYSPWSSFGEIATKFLDAKHRGREALRVFTNTVLGETFEEAGETLEEAPLMKRREEYGPEVPAQACVLTAGVDVQKNRFEITIDAWGEGEESWNLDHRVIPGDTSRQESWAELDAFLSREWKHESGALLPISCCLIDSGYNADVVYGFVKTRQKRRVYAVKGSKTQPLLLKPVSYKRGRKKSLAQKMGIALRIVGTDVGKRTIYDRLERDDVGPGYMHFPMQRDEQYFEGLTAEIIKTKYVGGVEKRVWELKPNRRNEPLDCKLYAFAALRILTDAGLDLAQHHALLVDEPKDKPTQTKPIRKKRSFATSW